MLHWGWFNLETILITKKQKNMPVTYKGVPVFVQDKDILPSHCHVIETDQGVHRPLCREIIGTSLNVGDTIEIDGVTHAVTSIREATQADLDSGLVLNLEATS